MNKKWLLISILVFTIIIIGLILIFNRDIRYNKLIVNESKWNNIISNRKSSTSISLENIKFNDYNLLIDEENSILYYSITESSKKYNPIVNYKASNKKIKIAVNEQITEEKIEQRKELKVIIYDENNYRIYTLVITNYPMLNIVYNGELNTKNRIDIKLELFDNYINSPQRLLKSKGRFKIIEDNKEYRFSLIKESLGHNERENHISIFGMEKYDEYTLKIVENYNESEKYVNLFINNKYVGLYLLSSERRADRIERNK